MTNRSLFLAALTLCAAFASLTGVRAGAATVCIDPGHPSETSAGATANGLSENTLNWQVGARLEAILEAEGITVVMTKHAEHQYVTNRQRAETANQSRAAMFIRLHCDVGSGSGFTWYYPDHAGTKYGVTGPPAYVWKSSRILASELNSTMAADLRGKLASNAIKTDSATFVGGHQGGVLTGSIFSRVPTALIEMCFINQRHDARFIASQAGQDAMAHALADGIEAYLRRH